MRLEAARREYLPECVTTDGPALGLTPTNSNTRSPAATDCQGASLAILKKSAPVIAVLNEAATQPAKIATTLSLVKELRELAIRYSEQADAKVNPTYDKVRKLQTQANDHGCAH